MYIDVLRMSKDCLLFFWLSGSLRNHLFNLRAPFAENWGCHRVETLPRLDSLSQYSHFWKHPFVYFVHSFSIQTQLNLSELFGFVRPCDLAPCQAGVMLRSTGPRRSFLANRIYRCGCHFWHSAYCILQVHLESRYQSSHSWCSGVRVTDLCQMPNVPVELVDHHHSGGFGSDGAAGVS